MRERGVRVLCYACHREGRYIEATLWSCKRCGGSIFTLIDPAYRKNWWEHFNDTLLTDHTLERLADNPIARKMLDMKWKSTFMIGRR